MTTTVNDDAVFGAVKRYAARMMQGGSRMNEDQAIASAEGRAEATAQAGNAGPAEWEDPEAVADEDVASEALSNVSVRPPLDPQHYNADGEMLGHELVPMDKPIDGALWCSVCGGHPTDPIHQPGWTP